MKQNWTSKECHEKNNEYVEHQDVNMYCVNCTRALGKTYHMIFDTKLGHSTCETRHILCVCVETTVFPYFLTVEQQLKYTEAQPIDIVIGDYYKKVRLE